ncbi:hypothetical protein FB451DRAFT_1263491, partial [Mycena latifolia]
MYFLPRRALSVAYCEIARAYKVAGSSIESIAKKMCAPCCCFCPLLTTASTRAECDAEI